MYIYPRRRKRRSPFLIALFAFVITAGFAVTFTWYKDPGLVMAALNLVRTPTPLETQTPTPDIGATDTPTPRRTNTPHPTQTPFPTPTLMPTATPINLLEHFIVGRPVPPDARSIVPDWTYLYGSTQHGDQAVHHGEEFVNPIGTPLVAAADGTIVVAGDDGNPMCGPKGDQVCGEKLDFYGNVVILRLDTPMEGQPVFAVYGHMSKIAVQVGQHVQAGEVVGAVGDSGVAEGPHVHFEIRLGVNDYAHTRNPILWMRPLPGRGAVAGIVQDRSNNPLRAVDVFLYADDANQTYIEDTATYSRDEHPAVNMDDHLHENWAMGDIPAGNYLLRANVGGLNYLKHITIQDGKLLFVVFGGP